MSTIANKLSSLFDIKTGFHTEIEAKGRPLSGKVFSEWPAEIALIEGGGGAKEFDIPGEDGTWRVRFIDWDGSVLKEEQVTEGGDATPPSDPTHADLVFQGWNFPHTNIQQPTDIQATYVTSDGKTHAWLLANGELGLSYTVYLNRTGAGEIEVDWGDGSSETSTSTGNISFSHTYSEAGDYQVKIGFVGDPGSSTYGFGYNSTTTFLGTGIQRDGLTRIHVGQYVPTIHNYSFRYCTSLDFVTLPLSCTAIGATTTGYSFAYCHALVNVSIPDTVTTIRRSSFQDCHALRTVTTMSGTIGHSVGNAFLNCYSLLVATIADSSVVYTGSFDKCYSLEYIKFEASIGTNVLNESGVVKAKTLHVTDNLFSKCSGLSVVEILPTATSIGSLAFWECFSLRDVVFPTGITAIGDRAFHGCLGLTNVTLNEGLLSIGEQAFDRCHNLRAVVLPSTLTTIGNRAFYLCNSIEELVIPDSVTTLGSTVGVGPLEFMTALRSIQLPSGITMIGSRLLRGCRCLEEVVIPTNVTSIGAQAFEYCTGLRRLVIERTADMVTLTNSNALANNSSTLRIYVPDSLVLTYKNNSTWSTYADQIFPLSDLP